MESVLRALTIYLILLVVFRLAGRRTFANMTTFDLVLLLIISEATQQALLGDDYSVTTAFSVIATLIVLDIGFSYLKRFSPRAARLIDGLPLVVVEDGRPLHGRMRRARIDEGDVMVAARASRGLERMDQIKYAILEADGDITIIEKETPPDAAR